MGSTNRKADQELIDELRRYGRGDAYDEQPMPELGSEAIDFRVASESFAPIRKLRWTDLETLRMVTRHQGRRVPTVGGILLFGKERERYYPDAWIQAGRFRGKDMSRIADHMEIHSIPLRAVEEAIAFVEARSTERRSAPCAGSSAGTCRRSRCGRPSSTL